MWSSGDGPAWSYSGDPSSSPADALRFTIGDTDPNEPLLSDGEVAYLLANASGDPRVGAIAAIQALMTKAAGYVDESVGGVSLSLSQRVTNLKAVLDMLRAQVAYDSAPMPWGGGQSVSDKQSRASNPDRVRPYFTTHQNEFPGNPNPVLSSESGAFDAPPPGIDEDEE